MMTTKSKTPKIDVTSFSGVKVGELVPMNYTECFNLSPFSSDPRFPYTPVIISKDGFEYAHCGCPTEEMCLNMIHESCFGTDAVFLFLMEGPEIKYGWFLDWDKEL